MLQLSCKNLFHGWTAYENSFICWKRKIVHTFFFFFFNHQRGEKEFLSNRRKFKDSKEIRSLTRRAALSLISRRSISTVTVSGGKEKLNRLYHFLFLYRFEREHFHITWKLEVFSDHRLREVSEDWFVNSIWMALKKFEGKTGWRKFCLGIISDSICSADKGTRKNWFRLVVSAIISTLESEHKKLRVFYNLWCLRWVLRGKSLNAICD